MVELPKILNEEMINLKQVFRLGHMVDFHIVLAFRRTMDTQKQVEHE